MVAADDDDDDDLLAGGGAVAAAVVAAAVARCLLLQLTRVVDSYNVCSHYYSALVMLLFLLLTKFTHKAMRTFYSILEMIITFNNSIIAAAVASNILTSNSMPYIAIVLIVIADTC